MEYSSSRERRRAAAASRRAARENTSNNGIVISPSNDGGSNSGGVGGGFGNNRNTYDEPRHRRIKQSSPPRRLQRSFLSSLSQALTNIDRHNNDHVSSRSQADAISSNNNNTSTMMETGVFNINAHSNISSSSHNSPYNNKYSKKQPTPPTHFSSYLKFTRQTICTLLLFTSCYILILFCTLPMISYSNIDILETDDATAAAVGPHHVKRGASFQRIRGRHQYQIVKQQLGTLKERAIQWEENAKHTAREEALLWQEKERKIVDLAISGDTTLGRQDVSRASRLLEEAVNEFEVEVEEKEKAEKNNNRHDEHWVHALEAWEQLVAKEEDAEEADVQNEDAAGINDNSKHKKRPGFIVLGMHRSGTSMLAGLLVEGFGYETGGPLIMPSFDNEKGFYERIDVVLQNDAFFNAQGMGWSFNVINYDSDKALRDKLQGTINFDEGKRALQFLNNHKKTRPYLQKDPRMCIALPTWLKLLDDEPAIVFTYRHPLEVAMSLKKREASITLEHGLRLWIVYNMRAIQNSAGLCRVLSTNEAVLKDPSREVQRIKNELSDNCNVMPPPSALISQKVVDSFIDPNLQHNGKERKKDEKASSTLKDFGGGCVAKEFESDYKKGSSNYEAEKQIFLMAMQIFCDFENGKAYEVDYEWPDLIHWQRPARIN